MMVKFTYFCLRLDNLSDISEVIHRWTAVIDYLINKVTIIS